jgi:thioesterase domain-containing protein/acyl carrier protein
VDLRVHLQQTLPEHMVPALFVAMAGLPRLTNGKLDRRSLPPPHHGVRDRRGIAPRDPVERRLTRVWAQVLGTNQIGVTDDFFDLGGHSLLAVQLVSAIHTEFGRQLPLAQLLAHPTIERLAVALQGAGDVQDWRPLVEIAAGGSAPPLFLLPGAGGNVIYFHALTRYLSATRQIYGLQAIGLDGRTPAMTTVEAIASVNVAAMRRARPAGPYFLAGHSFGGHVALEMAQQLGQQGETVGLLAILDTVAPAFDPSAFTAGWQDAQWLAKIAREIGEFLGTRLGVTIEDLQPLPLEEQLTHVVERMRRAGAWGPGAGTDQLRGYLQVYKANIQTPHVRYDTIAPVPIVLFKALEKEPDLDGTPPGLVALTGQPSWGWQRFASEPVGVVEVPGAHLSMLTEPHVAVLARALDAALQVADRRSRPSSAGVVA